MVAAVLAALAGLLAYSSITQRRAEVESGWEPTPVLVAAETFREGRCWIKTCCGSKRSPRLVTPSIVRSDLLASVQDAKLLLPMKQGDLLNFNMLQGTQMSEALSQDLAKGVRALSLRVNVESSVNRMVRPNDHVDVLLTYRDPTTRTVTTQTLLENIVVLATGEIYGGTALGFVDDEARKYVTVTVELTPQEVELAVQAQSMGAIYMSLRHPDDPEVMEDRARTNVQTIMTGERADQLRNKRRKAPRLPQVLRGPGSDRRPGRWSQRAPPGCSLTPRGWRSCAISDSVGYLEENLSRREAVLRHPQSTGDPVACRGAERFGPRLGDHGDDKIILACGLFLPGIYIRTLTARRLARSMNNWSIRSTLSSAFRAGLSFAQALEAVADEAEDPLGHEFRIAVREMRMGVEIPTALNNVADWTGSEDMATVATSTAVAAGMGGNMAEMFEAISSSSRAPNRGPHQRLDGDGTCRASSWRCCPALPSP